MITVKKSVLENFVKRIVESRSDGNSYADMTGTMFDNFEEEPIKPTEMMSTQLSVEAPPVDDPEYVPGTTGELGRAAQLISDEVPEDQIEKVYRQFHKILDAALDRHEDAKNSDSLAENLFRLLESSQGPGDDDEFGDEDDDAARWLAQNDPGEDYADEPVSSEEYSESPKTITLGDIATQMKVLGDKNKERAAEIEAEYQEFKKKHVKSVSVDSSKLIEPRITYAAKAVKAVIEGSEVPPELQSLADHANSWEFDNPNAPDHLDAVFIIMHAVYEVNYQMMIANHGLKYGGFRIAEVDRGFGKQLGFVAYRPGVPGSREHYLGTMEDITAKYGILYKDVIRFRTVHNLPPEQLESLLQGIIKGLVNHNRAFKEPFIKFSDHIAQTGDEAIGSLAKLLRMAYQEEVEKEDVDVDATIRIFFSRRRKQEYYTDEYFTMHAYKDGDAIRKSYPVEILNLMKTSNKPKVFSKGKFVVAHPNIPEKVKEFDEASMLQAIESHVNAAVTASEDFYKDRLEDETISDLERQELTAEEEEQKETAKMLKKLEKEANPKNYTHIAPLYGFSGESGLRQWVLKFPERKMRMLKLGKSSPGEYPGLAEFVSMTREIYQLIFRNLPIYIQFVQQEGQTRQFVKDMEQLKSKLGVSFSKLELSDEFKDMSPEELEALQLKDMETIFKLVGEDMDMINDTMGAMEFDDISIIQAAIEEEEEVPYMLLTDYVQDQPPDELEDLVLAYNRGMMGVGGHIARGALGDIMDDIITKTDKKWSDTIANNITKKFPGINASTAKTLSEHFMGKKNPPDFDKPNKKGTKTFLDLGISEVDFYDLYAAAIVEYDKIISEEIEKKTNDARSLLAKLRAADMASYNLTVKGEDGNFRKLSDKEKEVIRNNALEVYPGIIAKGLRDFDDSVEIEKRLRIKREEFEAAKKENESINEIKMLVNIIERLM